MDIIMYCKENSVPLMFVSTPYRMTAQRSERMNTLADIAGEYGIPFLNCNYYYEEIGIDFTSDMKDRNHVNLLGAKKFTEFFAKYLTEHFDLPDHRGESSSVWNEWNALYEKYDVYLKEKEKILQAVVRSEKQTREAQKRMVLSQDAFEWLMLAKNERYTLVMLANESFEHRPSPKGMAALSAFGYERAYLDESNPVLIVYRDGVRYSSNSEMQYDGLLPETQRGCSIVSGEHPQICVGGANYLESYPGGLCIAAVNNLTNDTFDKVSIAVEADGSLTLTHL